MNRPFHVVDVNHFDAPDFEALHAAGVVGVILKATQGTSFVDPKYHAFLDKCLSLWDSRCVHSYHYLDGSDPAAQISNYLTVTQGRPGRWLDYETALPGHSQCSLDQAVKACHILAQKQGKLPGMYGSDKDRLGAAIDAGHFVGSCPMWLARYGSQPSHECDLWQWQAGESGTVKLAGICYDANAFTGTADECRAFLMKMAA